MKKSLADFLAATAIILVGILCSCVPMGSNIAGTSTEAGNAGGKLSLANGQPASGVSVALVARSYIPDTLSHGPGDLAGSYYRTRTGPDGRFQIPNVAPGDYRVMAVGEGGGALAESLQVKAGTDTSWVDETLKPLGRIRGVVALIGSATKTNLWISPKATVLASPEADTAGTFSLDSLPEGEYELVPKCYSCQPLPHGYRVRVRAGRDTLLADTLKLYPDYFQGFPDSGTLDLRAAFLPLSLGGKINRGPDEKARPVSVRWTWNGGMLAGKDVAGPGGIAETMVLLDSALFFPILSDSGKPADAGMDRPAEGRLRLELVFPDTVVSREWHVVVNASRKLWPLSAVEVDGGARIPGPAAYPMWRFHVLRSLRLDSADVAFWGLRIGEPNPNTADLPDSVDLGVDDADGAMLAGARTFILVPDARFGGRVFRPRADERLDDFAEIRFLRRDALGFADSLVPSMLPGGLIVDRVRGASARQRYRIDSLGGVEEILAPGPDPEPPLLFFRSGPAAAGFSWDRPFMGASRVITVTRAGRALRLDGSGTVAASSLLPDAELGALASLLAPMNGRPPALPDTAALAGDGTWEYLRYGQRGILASAGSGGKADTLFTALKAWMVRNGLEEEPRFPLSGAGPLIYLGFTADSGGIRTTGDTLVLERAADDSGLQIREYLSAGSPARVSGDTAAFVYRLERAGDSLVATTGPIPAASRLLGNIDGRKALFALTDLAPIAPAYQFGLPMLGGTGGSGVDARILAGRLEPSFVIHGRIVAAPSLYLDGRGIELGRQGIGFLYTPDGGLERSWRFGGRSGSVGGWDRL